MANVPFSTSVFGKRLNAVSKTRRLSVGLLGESHGTSYLAATVACACYRHYHADITMDFRPFASGGQMFAVGGSTTTSTSPRGLALQLTDFATNPTDIAIIAAGYNDQPTTEAAAITTATNVLNAAAACLAAGALYVIIMGMTPRNYPAPWYTVNNIWRQACFSNPHLFFVDVTSALAARDSSSLVYRGPSAGTAGAFTVDGTHWGALGVRQVAPLLADVFRIIAPERIPRVSHNSGDYNPSTASYGNILGDAGNMMGTAGILGASLNTGVAGTSAASRVVVANGTGGLTATPSIVTGASGERKQRVAVGGTISGSGNITVSITPTIATPNNGDATRMMDVEAVIDLAAVDGLVDIFLRPLSITYDTAKLAQTQSPGGYWGAVTEQWFIYNLSPIPIPAAANPVFSLSFLFRSDAGFVPSGTIDISRFGAFRTV